MKKLYFVAQKVEEPGFLKKPQQGREKMLAKSTNHKDMSSGKRGLVPRDPEPQGEGALCRLLGW